MIFSQKEMSGNAEWSQRCVRPFVHKSDASIQVFENNTIGEVTWCSFSSGTQRKSASSSSSARPAQPPASPESSKIHFTRFDLSNTNASKEAATSRLISRAIEMFCSNSNVWCCAPQDGGGVGGLQSCSRSAQTVSEPLAVGRCKAGCARQREL